MRQIGELRVFPVAIGTMNLSGEGRPSRDTAIATLRAALDEGVSLIDTADVYGLDGDDQHHGERLVAEAGGEAHVSTKVGVKREGDAWLHDGRPRYLRDACEGSLRALGVETIDLLHLHAVDERVPIEESVGELSRLRDEGKARHLGVSNVDAEQLRRAIATTAIVSVQNEASLFVAPDPEIVAICEAEGLALLGYAPMGGWRAGRVAHEPLLRALAERYGATPFQIVLAALLGRSDVIIPVCGASRPQNARSSARAVALVLSAEHQGEVTRRFWPTSPAE